MEYSDTYVFVVKFPTAGFLLHNPQSAGSFLWILTIRAAGKAYSRAIPFWR